MLSPKPPYIRISPKVFLSPSASIRFTSGYITDWNGISIAAVKQRNRKLLALVLFLTIIQAVRDDITTISATATTVMMSVFTTDSPSLICAAAFTR